MPYIDVTPELPGIISLLSAYPYIAGPLNAFTQQLLRGESSLTPGERELIAAFVSGRNECKFCMRAHTAVAKNLLPNDQSKSVDKVVNQSDFGTVDKKMQALLDIAASVQKGGKQVTREQIDRARFNGADDRAIHDAVLIAAAFCMFNRYVDGLDTWTPEEPQIYESIGTRLAAQGYVGTNKNQ